MVLQGLSDHLNVSGKEMMWGSLTWSSVIGVKSHLHCHLQTNALHTESLLSLESIATAVLVQTNMKH